MLSRPLSGGFFGSNRKSLIGERISNRARREIGGKGGTCCAEQMVRCNRRVTGYSKEHRSSHCRRDCGDIRANGGSEICLPGKGQFLDDSLEDVHGCGNCARASRLDVLEVESRSLPGPNPEESNIPKARKEMTQMVANRDSTHQFRSIAFASQRTSGIVSVNMDETTSANPGFRQWKSSYSLPT